MWLSVSTANQQDNSAKQIRGRTVKPIVLIVEMPVECESLNKRSAHCHAKQSSAIVATDRPRKTEQNGESHMHIRSTSILGRIDRKEQAATKRPDNMICLN